MGFKEFHLTFGSMRMDLGEVEWGEVDCMGLAQDRNRRRALVNAVIKPGFYEMLENCQVAQQLVASRVVLSSIELVS
jgi:hypothetical protein